MAQSVLDTAIGALPDKHKKINKIRVTAGVLSGVEKDSLVYFFNEIKKGTPAENATLDIDDSMAELNCKACGHKVPFDNLRPIAIKCEKCGGQNVLTGGKQFSMETMEVED